LVVPQQDSKEASELPLSDEEAVTLVERKAAELHRRLGENYQFYVAAEGGLDLVEAAGGTRTFVRYWAAVSSDLGDALGCSSAVEIPRSLLSGLGSEEVRYAFPGTRRSGGVLRALTGGTETPRLAVAAATTNALFTLFYGMLEGRSTPDSFLPPGRAS
ncbi:MAG: DUF84 family protein, partial [Acidobacteria bacterium]|nr:DUF84 family protein [Acidobacteriota bacterium]